MVFQTIHVICLVIILNKISQCEQTEDEDDLVTSFRQFRQNEQHVCSLYIYADPFLWRQVYLLEGNYIIYEVSLAKSRQFTTMENPEK